MIKCKIKCLPKSDIYTFHPIIKWIEANCKIIDYHAVFKDYQNTRVLQGIIFEHITDYEFFRLIFNDKLEIEQVQFLE